MKSNYKETWHVLHFIITVLFPFWVVVWVARAAINNGHNRRVEHQEMLDMMGKMNNNIQNPPARQDRGSWTE